MDWEWSDPPLMVLFSIRTLPDSSVSTVPSILVSLIVTSGSRMVSPQFTILALITTWLCRMVHGPV